jgi:hypothetical protein
MSSYSSNPDPKIQKLLTKKFFQHLLRDIEEFTYQYVWDTYGYMDQEELEDNGLEFLDQYFRPKKKIIKDKAILKYVELIGSKKILKVCMELGNTCLRSGLLSFILDNFGPQEIFIKGKFDEWLKINA